MEILKAENIRVSYFSREGERKIVDDVSFSLYAGRSLAVLGGVGSGKSMLARAVCSLLPPDVKMAGGRCKTDKKLLFIPKDPTAFFQKDKTVGKQLDEKLLAPDLVARARLEEMLNLLLFSDFFLEDEILPTAEKLAANRPRGRSKSKARDRARYLLDKSNLTDDEADILAGRIAPLYLQKDESYLPSLRERYLAVAGIESGDVLNFKPAFLTMDSLKLLSLAFAAAERPDILVLDEPTSYVGAVDKESVMRAAERLKRIGVSLVVLTRHIDVAKRLCDDALVLYRGRALERGTAEEVFGSPVHEYVKALLRDEDILSLAGANTDDLDKKAGCPYAYSCRKAEGECRALPPRAFYLSPTHVTSCRRALLEGGKTEDFGTPFASDEGIVYASAGYKNNAEF